MKNKKMIILIIAIVVVAIVSTVLTVLFFVKKSGPGGGSTTENEPTETTEYKDYGSNTDAYFHDKSEVLSVIDADKSEDVLKEKEVEEDVLNRGIDQYYIYTDYGMDGTLYEEELQVEEKEDKHPQYTTYYTNSKDEIWTIYVVNNKLMANPATYNLESGKDIQVVFSEEDSITSYDCYHNKFYTVIPKPSEMILIKVDRIDSETLDKWTVEEIQKYLD